MTAPHSSSDLPDAWSALEPYEQLVKSLFPRASAVAVFDAGGALQWSSETAVDAELTAAVAETFPLPAGDTSPGKLEKLPSGVPAYICRLRNDAGELLALVAISCRISGTDTAPREFSFVHSLLRPALECLRRDLGARSTISRLNRAVTALDRDLEVLLTDPTEASTAEEPGTDDLKSILQSAAEHLKCSIAALIVPEKGIVQMALTGQKGPDGQVLARTHRQLLSMAQLRRTPVIINRIAPGAIVPVPYRILSCPVRHATGRTMGVLALFRDQDVEEFVERDARLADLLARKAAVVVATSYDSLSGLYTRHAFEQRLRATLAENTRAASWSALYIDSDQLHVINDNFGMHIGDNVIAQLGELMRRRLPPGAFAARISGDRFAVVLPTGIEDAQRFAEALREGAEQLGAVHGDSRLHVSISIGVAPLGLQASELSHSLAAAESACKAAKDRGRNRVETYQPADHSIVRRFSDINVASRVRHAIQHGNLRLDGQLILPLGSSQSSRPHFELLLRMIDEEGRTIGPDGFLSAANRYQLMPTIDRWVVNQAIEQLAPHARLLGAGSVVFAVNFSGQSLNDGEFSDFLLDSIRHSGLDPTVFCFELTETATIQNLERAEVFMRALRRLGCEVALDDFGTGLSSLAYLRRLPVTMLKIDGSFVRDILKDERSESMVKAIAQLARGMSLTTVAEYVETTEIHRRVAALGVDYGQGFAIGRPLPLEDVLTDLPLLISAAPVACTPEAPYAEPRVANYV